MREFPLLGLETLWKDAHSVLTELEAFAAELYAESEQTWGEMERVHTQAVNALHTLGSLPPGIREGIAKDEADLAEMEDRADASSY